VQQHRIVILGATGGTGRALVSQALEAGHHVTAFVRNPDKLALRRERLRVLAGDAASGAPTLGDAVRGQDAVISALGRGRSFKAQGLMQRSVPHILEVMRDYKVPRFIFMSAMGVGETGRDAPLMSRMFSSLFLKDIFADKLAAEGLIRRSSVEWTIVHPTLLTDGPLTGTYRIGERLELHGMPKISRADTAHFMLAQLSDPTYVRKTVIVSY
jgi:putative NADH-flavin reductase